MPIIPKPSKPPKYFVVANDRSEFREYVYSRSQEFLDKYDIRYVASPDVLRGHKDYNGVILSSARNRTDYKEILIQLAVSRVNGANEKLDAIIKDPYWNTNIND